MKLSVEKRGAVVLFSQGGAQDGFWLSESDAFDLAIELLKLAEPRSIDTQFVTPATRVWVSIRPRVDVEIHPGLEKAGTGHL